jgi:hypothetical protein
MLVLAGEQEIEELVKNRGSDPNLQALQPAIRHSKRIKMPLT